MQLHGGSGSSYWYLRKESVPSFDVTKGWFQEPVCRCSGSFELVKAHLTVLLLVWKNTATERKPCLHKRQVFAQKCSWFGPALTLKWVIWQCIWGHTLRDGYICERHLTLRVNIKTNLVLESLKSQLKNPDPRYRRPLLLITSLPTSN